MSYMFDTLFYLGRNGEIDPTLLEGRFAALHLRDCAPDRLLAKYTESSDNVNLEDPCEDLDAHEQIFHYGVISALQCEDDFAWLQELSRFDSDADRLFKAVALFKLVAFFRFGELYTRGDTSLEKTLWTGAFTDPFFRHVYLYEFLARDITPHQSKLLQPHPWARVQAHGRNFVDMFGDNERIDLVREGRVARLFAQGLLSRIGAAALNPELTPSYKTFFEAYVRSHNAHRGSQMQWAHGHETWDLKTLSNRLLAGLLNEHFDDPTLTRIFQAVVQ